jgi:hypothetical protein
MIIIIKISLDNSLPPLQSLSAGQARNFWTRGQFSVTLVLEQ